MSLPMADSPDQLCQRMRDAISNALPGAVAKVEALGPGHFTVEVTSNAFEGKGLVDQQRLVYSALKPFLTGNDPPVHAIDRLKTRTQETPS